MNAKIPSGEQTQSPPQQLHIRCARELFEALESCDGSTRHRALQAVQKAPATALSFGRHAHRDVVDVLLSQAERFRGELEWLYWIGALAAFRDCRVVRLFTSVIATESHAELLFALANYLRTEPLDQIRFQLSTALLQNECVARARAVAVVLAGCACPSKAETLRLGLLEENGDSLLPIFSACEEEWLSELMGLFQPEARMGLQRQGASTLIALVGYWDRFSESTKRWLLEWAAETDAGLVLEPIRNVLTTGPDTLLVTALETAAKLKELPGELETLITPLVHHHEELVRRAAVLSCRSRLNWDLLFESEPSALVRQAHIAKMIEQQGREAIPFALRHMSNPDWRIRAAAAEGLLSLGKPGVQAAFRLLPEAGEFVRTSIARMVLQLADEDLLDEFIQFSELLPR